VIARFLASAGITLLTATTGFAGSAFESSKLSPGAVLQGSAFKSPKLSPGVVLQGNAFKSAKLSPGVVVQGGGFQSSKISVGIVLQVLNSPRGVVQRDPRTHW